MHKLYYTFASCSLLAMRKTTVYYNFLNFVLLIMIRSYTRLVTKSSGGCEIDIKYIKKHEQSHDQRSCIQTSIAKIM